LSFLTKQSADPESREDISKLVRNSI